MKDRIAFSKMVSALLSVYGPPPTKEVIAIWWGVLGNFLEEEIKRGFATFADESEKRPTPAGIKKQLTGITDKEASLAWTWVIEALDKYGSSGLLDFVGFDAVHCAVKEVGGWRVFCESDPNNRSFLRRDFLEAYKNHKALGSMADYYIGYRAQDDAQVVILDPPAELKALVATQAKRLTGGQRLAIEGGNK